MITIKNATQYICDWDGQCLANADSVFTDVESRKDKNGKSHIETIILGYSCDEHFYEVKKQIEKDYNNYSEKNHSLDANPEKYPLKDPEENDKS